MNDERRIAIVGDVHHHIERLTAVLPGLRAACPSLALLVGDLGIDPPWSVAGRRTARAEHDASVRDVLARTRRELGCPVAFVPGNHDLPDPPAEQPATNCDGRLVDLAGLRVLGLGGAGPHVYGFAYEWTETIAAERIARATLATEGAVDVLLCHAPPAATPLDRTSRGEHVGSRAVAAAIERLSPALFVCGHIHEAPGVYEIAGRPALNAGALGEPHGQEIAWSVSWAEGRPVAIDCLGPSSSDGRRRCWP